MINGLQIVILYTFWLHQIMWLSSADFKGASVALWVAGILYFAGFWFMSVCVLSFIDQTSES